MLISEKRVEADRPLAFDALLGRYDPSVIDLFGRDARIRLTGSHRSWDVLLRGGSAEFADPEGEPDCVIAAEDTDWRRLALDIGGGMDSFRAGGLRIRRNLHLGIGFLAATSGNDEPGRMRFASYGTSAGRISTVEAGLGKPLLCLPGLGGTKASFMSTISMLAPERRVIAVDLPGFGDSDKPLTGAYDAAWYSEIVLELLDRLGLDRADLIGNSMGGRVAIEFGLRRPDRTGRLVLLSPAMAWLQHDPRLKRLLQLPLPRLSLLQPTPRKLVGAIARRLVPGGESSWVAAGIDEFARAFSTAGGRYAFYESARNLFRDEPFGPSGFWERRLGELGPESLFVWGREDTLVPIGFRKHVEAALPAADHLELDCGHVPQIEAPGETHAAVSRFLSA